MSDAVDNKIKISGHTENLTNKYSLNYALEQIEKISSQTDYLDRAIRELSQMASVGPGDIAGAEKAKAIADLVHCRETTNQQLLEFYIKMAEDLK